jgi:hypothetical protein
MELIDKHIKLLLQHKDLQNPNSFEDLGYNFFGPIVFNFFDWLRKELDGCDLVLFNSREGYFFIQIYELFKEKYNLPKYEYFKTSRKLSTIASLKTEQDIYDTFKLHRYSGSLKGLLKNRFGIDTEDNFEIDTSKEIPNLTKYINDILNNAKRVRSEYGKYVKDVIGNSKNVIMVDSGFQGTTQYNIQNTFGVNLKGRYITYKGNLPLKDTKGFCEFYKANFKDNIIFFESIFTDKLGTYIDIAFDGNFINEDIEIVNFDKKEKVVNGIIKFVNDVFNLYIEYEISYEYPDYIFNLMCKKDYISKSNFFDIFLHDNYYVRDVIKKINRI